eukprot:scaffold3596_cov126-Cylindrotheca_fusiformis.AAC.14
MVYELKRASWHSCLMWLLIATALDERMPTSVSAFIPSTSTASDCTIPWHQQSPNVLLLGMWSDALDRDDDEYDDEDGEDDDDAEIQPYRNRSLAWTKRYRKLNPYEQCRQRVLQFGHRSKKDWDEAMESGQLGSYVPCYPDEMYAPEWISWEEWLGLMRSYDETKQLAVHVLQLKSLDEYILFVRSNAQRAEGLRIPVRPDLFYKEEWTTEQDFFRPGT